MNYTETIDWLFNQFPSYQNIGVNAYKPDLSNIETLCKVLEIDFNTLKFVHIAGTNGKGTTTNMLSSILIEEGYKVGTFTSPHIEDFRERIVINNKLISEDFVIEFCKKTQIKSLTITPSFFEITFAMALAYFINEKCDICVIETGLGGRLDSTNIIQPIVSVITNISLDHTDILGDTIEKIAYEKGGIIKKNTPIIIGEFDDKALRVFESIANKLNANLIKAWEENFDKESLINEKGYLFKNEITVKATCQILRKFIHISEENITKGIGKVYLNTPYRGRFQIINTTPTIILDVGHNIDGITSNVLMVKNQLKGKLHIIYGASADKDVNQILTLFPKDSDVYFTEFTNSRSIKKADIINNKLINFHFKDFFSSINEIYPRLKNSVNENDTILITGSFFLIHDFFSFFSKKNL